MINQILNFSGCWCDLSEQEFDQYLSTILMNRWPCLSDEEFQQLLQTSLLDQNAIISKLENNGSVSRQT